MKIFNVQREARKKKERAFSKRFSPYRNIFGIIYTGRSYSITYMAAYKTRRTIYVVAAASNISYVIDIIDRSSLTTSLHA